MPRLQQVIDRALTSPMNNNLYNSCYQLETPLLRCFLAAHADSLFCPQLNIRLKSTPMLYTLSLGVSKLFVTI